MSGPVWGQATVVDANSEHTAKAFQIKQALARVNTMVPVKVVKVHGGGVGPPPTVDVQILVNQTDGVGNSTPHGIVYGIPSPRQGNASYQVIADPKVGDLGHIVCSHRDISSVKKALGQANPGSSRRFSMADSIYHGGVWGASAAPSQYVQMTDSGVTIVDKNGNSIVTGSGGVSITCTKLTVNGDIKATGAIEAGGEIKTDLNNAHLSTHIHSGVAVGGANTAAPVAGS